MTVEAMDKEQYTKRFAMDADFDDGRWIDNKFYYPRHKELTPPQTWDNAIYNIFTDSDFDSDGRGSSRKQCRSGTATGKPDLTKPVSFVSPGIVMPNQEIDRAAAEKREGGSSGTVGSRGSREDLVGGQLDKAARGRHDRSQPFFKKKYNRSSLSL